MKRLLVLAMVCLIAVGAANAGDSKATAKSSKAGGSAPATHVHKPLNNVVKMDAAGKRTALCCCGAEFTVTDNTPTLDHDGTLFYMCGEGCKEIAMKASAEATRKTMADWQKKYDAIELRSNATVTSGKQMATCACGKEFEVTADSPALIENGVKAYCCTEACHTMFLSMSAADRLAAEQKMLASVAPKGSGK